jgi:hypothetical protein
MGGQFSDAVQTYRLQAMRGLVSHANGAMKNKKRRLGRRVGLKARQFVRS